MIPALSRLLELARKATPGPRRIARLLPFLAALAVLVGVLVHDASSSLRPRPGHHKVRCCCELVDGGWCCGEQDACYGGLVEGCYGCKG